MTLVGRAFAIAADVHKDQVDKAGEPYMLHPVAVMELATEYHLKTSDGFQLEKVQATALLHDAVEDVRDDLRPLIAARINDLDQRVSEAVEALTKRGTVQNKEPYDTYLGRVEEDWIARIVKIADLTHNLDAFRIPSRIGERDFERWDKYHRALVRLSHG